MILVKVVKDQTMAISGFEHRFFMCPECHDTEQRLAFDKERKDDTTPVPENAGALFENVPILTAPPTAPISSIQDEGEATFLKRVLAKIRRH